MGLPGVSEFKLLNLEKAMNELAEYLLETQFKDELDKLQEKIVSRIKAVNPTRIVGKIQSYKNGSYYTSKNKRIQQIVLPVEQLLEKAVMSVVLYPGPIQNAATHLGYQLMDNNLDGVKTAAEIISVIAQEDGLIDMELRNDGSPMVKPAWEICAVKAKYPLPMLTKPREIISQVDRARMTSTDRNHLILGKEHQHDDFICIDTINILNSIEIEIDEDVLDYEESLLGTATSPEIERMFIESTESYQEIMNWGNKFYFTWKYDFRGRMYSSGYHLQYQSYNYKRSLISFHHKEVVT